MKVYGVVFMMTVFLLSCSPDVQHTIQKLPSGREIKIISIGKMQFSDDTALMLKYQTDSNIDNTAMLRREAEEIWPVFRVNVEKSGLNSAVITATSPPITRYFFFHTSRSFNFVVTRKDNGSWDFNKWGHDYDSDSKNLAEQHLRNIINGDMKETAGTLYFPADFTASELKTEINGISKALKIIFDELGTIDSYTASKVSDTYSFIYLQSATTEFWNKYPYFNTQIYDVTYSRKGKGFIIIRFSIVEDKNVISFVQYALPATNPESEAIIKNIKNRLMKEIST